MTSAATRYAAEGCLIEAIGFVDMSALGAPSRGIPRIDQGNRNARKRGFVRNAGLQLRERPAMQNGALRLSSPHPRVNVLEVFKRNPSLRALSPPNNAFAERMVDIPGKAGFLSRQLPQASLCRQGAFFLELVPEPPMAIPNAFDRAAAVDRAVAISGDVGHAQIDPKYVVDVDRVRRFDLGSRKEIPVAAHEHQIALAAPKHKQLPRLFAAHKRDGLPLIERPDRNRRIRQCKRENTIIIGDCGCRAKCAFRARVKLVGVAYFCQCADDHLRRQVECFAHILIAQLLKRKLAKSARLPRHVTDVVACRVRGFKRASERIGLIGRR